MSQYSLIDLHTCDLERFLAELPSENGIEVRWAEAAETKARNIVFWFENKNSKRLLLLKFTPSSYSYIENIIRVEEVIDRGGSASGVLVTDLSVFTDPHESPQDAAYKLTAEEHLRLQQWLGLTTQRQ